mmetsp:Transcript_3564/g.8927  ORF Transcript_3564/g.8927 Transcript_3564/m.8927 type:complete len:671 (-) Transcript_3564:49-2061(-)
MAGAVHIEDLRRALGSQSSTTFDEATLRFFQGSFDVGLRNVDVNELQASWLPLLIDNGACSDEAQARTLCEKVLEQLRTPTAAAQAAATSSTAGAEPPKGVVEPDISMELIPWLEQLKLKNYQAKAEEWCRNEGAIKMQEIFENIDNFSETLCLKPLEVKRVKKAVEAATKKPDQPAQIAAAAAAEVAPRPGAGGCAPTQSRYGYVGEYAVMEELGEGATAKVYRCVKGEEAFAMKTISLSKLRMQRDFQRISDRLQREIQILFSLRHPKIVSLFGVEEDKDNLHLIMELVPGRDLFDKIVEKGQFQEPVAKYVFVQICEGLEYIHSKGIVYRDLKPENILVEREREEQGLTLIEIKLTDFGHSKLINDGYSIPLTRVGTPQYWAPEVSDAKQAARGYGREVDLWSLGVVVYVMLIGTYPFNGIGESIDVQIRNAKLDFRNRLVSQSGQKLIRSLIQVKPMDRLPLQQCLEHQWAEGARPFLNRLMKLSTVSGPMSNIEECLPMAAAVNREQLQRDLHHWMAKHRCAAQLRNGEVVATIPEAQYQDARAELEKLVRFFNDQAVGNGVGHPQAAAPPAVPSAPQRSRQFRTVTATLRVSPEEGAGLVLKPERGGMRVSEICTSPGQPDLIVQDLITAIQEVSLRGHPEAVQDIFGRHFVDGAQLSVKRETR